MDDGPGTSQMGGSGPTTKRREVECMAETANRRPDRRKGGRAFGYARVSARDQNEARQLEALREAGLSPERIYVDKQSGKDFDRPQYRRMVARMRVGDLLYVKSIDRLGRNYAEILEQWRVLTKEKQVDIVVLDMPLLDTRRGKDLMGTFLSDIVLQVLSFVAENERANIRQRQAEGIAAAKARGVRFGRPPRPLPEAFYPAFWRWKAGELTGVAAAKACGMPLTTFRYRAKALERQQHGHDGSAGESGNAGEDARGIYK